MKRLRLLMIVLIISTIGLLSWLYVNSRQIERLPRRATVVMETVYKRIARDMLDDKGLF